MAKVIKQKTKTLVTKPNGRSSDAVSPNFIYGCVGGCMQTYCYVGRFNHDKVYINENTDQILESIDKWVQTQEWPKKSNQCDDTFYTIDIGCSTDVALFSKHYDWQKVFTFFNEHPKLKSTFATKYPSRFPSDKFDINPEKNRLRISLMPQEFSTVVEPYTDLINTRLASYDRLSKMFEVHFNFSPVIVHDHWINRYNALFFDMMEKFQIGQVPCEVIFLTYNETSRERAADVVNEMLYKPVNQEYKESQYLKGSDQQNIRYKHEQKAVFVDAFERAYAKYYNISNIRYIF